MNMIRRSWAKQNCRSWKSKEWMSRSGLAHDWLYFSGYSQVGPVVAMPWTMGFIKSNSWSGNRP